MVTSGYSAGGGGGASQTQKRTEDTFQGQGTNACPLGSVLSYASDGSGKLVCRNTTTGRESNVPKPGLARSGNTTIQNTSPPVSSVTDLTDTLDSIIGQGGYRAGGSVANAGGVIGPSSVPGAINSGGDYLTQAADMFAAQPEALLADILEGQYGDSNRGMGLYGMLSPYGNAANYLFLAMTGQDAGGGTKQDFINWLDNDFWQAMMTPGAEFNVDQAMRNILNPAQNSPLAAYLSVGDPIRQSQNFENLATAIYSLGYHPLIAQAMADRLEYGQDAFIGEAGRGEVDPFYDWFQSQAPMFTARGY